MLIVRGALLMQLFLAARGDPVTCGSAIKIIHEETSYLLHSHDINYGSGSRQQSVTAHSRCLQILWSPPVGSASCPKLLHFSALFWLLLQHGRPRESVDRERGLRLRGLHHWSANTLRVYGERID
jgi:hypothetical protein